MSDDIKLDIESEDYNTLYANEIPPITKPYNPLDVDIISQPQTLTNIFDRLRNDEIDLSPDFQRNPNLWNKREQSRLIESILIKIPLPAFYFDCLEDDTWVVVDGLQRLTALKNFVVLSYNDKHKLKLSELEYLQDLNGKTYEDLPRLYQRRLNEENIFAYMIRPGTPDNVKVSIFKRINTGGLQLNNTEILNSVYRGKVSNLVKKMADAKEFLTATNNKISSKRMTDRDFVIRFLAFYILGYNKYGGNIEEFLNEALSYIKKEFTEKLEKDIYDTFTFSMQYCYEIFDSNAFRKYFTDKNGEKVFGPMNKALFETVSSELCFFSEDELKKILSHKEIFIEKYKLLFEGKFFDSITTSTGSIENVNIRHTIFKQFIDSFLENL